MKPVFLSIALLVTRPFVALASGLVVALAVGLFVVWPVVAEEPQPDQPEQEAKLAAFFESKIRPLLAEHCLKCHGADEQKGGLRLDSKDSLNKGGDSGVAIVPGKPDESLLLAAVRYESLEMPPKGKLPDAQIGLLAQWVALGAPWPKTDKPAGSDARSFTDEDRRWWAWQPVADPPVPQIKSSQPRSQWALNDVDRFILAKLAEQNLQPAAEADRPTLIRRLYFDLIGLPPSPEDVARFVADTEPQAYERLVDRLLDSPRYGERWARHWLDLVRYADSDGYRIDHYRPNSWRYRDYVVDSLNQDKPYDQFVREQIAGDELYPNDPQATIATGYLAHGIYEYNARDVRGQWDNILNEITDTTADVFLGIGLQCARCHDHKFDPLLQRDYYSLRAYFEGIGLQIDQPVATAAEKDAYHAALAEYERRTAEVRLRLFALEEPYRKAAEKGAIEKFPPEMQAIIRKDPARRTPHEQQLAELAWRQVDYEYGNIDAKLKGDDKDSVLALRRELAKFDLLKPKPLPLGLTIHDVSSDPPRTAIPKKGVDVAPGLPTILNATPPEISPKRAAGSSGRRAALAEWIARRDNPLSTRVIVNRVWQYHFGKGLAAVGSDFGRLGEAPSHPELLDWLTSRFLEGNWRLKPLHRLMVNSATYRQSTAHTEYASHSARDPSNRWYWRAHTRRLDAEQIRDAILATSGQLDLTAGGQGVMPDQPRRSIYTRVMRNSRDPLLDVFDLPLFFSSSSSRYSTTTPIQSLLLFNSQEMLRHGDFLASRVAKARGLKPGTGSQDKVTLIRDVCRLAWGREPTDREQAKAMAFFESQTKEHEATAQPAAPAISLADCPTGKIAYRTGQSIVIDGEKPPPLFVADREELKLGDFTIEAYFQVRSVYGTGAVRTLAAKWNGDRTQPGWAFGVTGKGSRRKPQTLVLQMFGKTATAPLAEVTVFSDQHLKLNRSYYAAASVKMAGDQPGEVKFYLKDLANDDEPLQEVAVPHSLRGDFANKLPLSIGRTQVASGVFDGLIDDVRLSNKALGREQLLFASEVSNKETVGYWRFEADTGMFRDTSSHGLHIESTSSATPSDDPQWKAFVDFCHVLLNSNQFLYVH